MTIPKLNELIQTPTAFLFGAGASKDYGFPLWEDLKQEFLNFIKPEMDGADFWIEALTDNERKHLTIDQLTMSADGRAVTLFQHTIAKVILYYEAKDKVSKTDDWIENFSNSLLEIAEDHSCLAMIINNLHFISLNYDRCFDYRYGNSFISKIPTLFPDHPWKIPGFVSNLNGGANFCTVHHCHGVPGGFSTPSWVEFKGAHVSGHTFLNTNKYSPVGYGDESTMNKANWNSGIISVDYAKKGKNGSYEQVNRILPATKNIIVIGLSPEGFEQSALVVPGTTTVYCSGSRPVCENAIIIGKNAEEAIEALVS